MNPYYPAFLDLRGKRVLIVGGGRVALQKARALSHCRARLAAVAPRFSSDFSRSARKGRIRLLRRPFRPEDLNGQDLVFCATNEEPLNRRVGLSCARRKIWVNVADRPGLCSFIVPAVVRRGEVTFAVSTGGASPALAKFLRKKIQWSFGAEVGRRARALRALRGRLKQVPLARRRKIIGRILRGGRRALPALRSIERDRPS